MDRGSAGIGNPHQSRLTGLWKKRVIARKAGSYSVFTRRRAINNPQKKGALCGAPRLFACQADC
jgi:hypothetical protein